MRKIQTRIHLTSTLTSLFSCRNPRKIISSLLTGSVALTIFTVAVAAQGAEFEIHPSIAVSEEYTDNVFETRAKRIPEYITRVLPGLALSYKAPSLTGDLNYVFDYRHYARKNHEDEIAHSLSAKGLLTAMENRLFLDVSDEYQRVSLDVTRDVTRESLFVNQADRNVATASPYLVLRPTERIMLKPGYRFIDTRYFKSSAINKSDHIAFLNMTYEITKKWNLTADYTFTRELADIGNYSQHLAFGGFRYEYADKSFVFAQAGKSWTRYDRGQRLNNLVWNAGITHVFDTVTGTLITGVRYNEDPRRNIVQESFVSANLEKRLHRGAVTLSPYYSEFVLLEKNALLTKKYGANAGLRYEFTADLSCMLGFTAEKYEQPPLGSYTRRLQTDTGFSYLLTKQLTVSLSHIYTDYYSPGILTDNRHVNRAIIEIKKIF